MKKIAYVFGQLSEATMAEINRLQPDLTFRDKTAQEHLRPQLKTALKALENGDELIIAKFSNTVRHTFGLSLLLDYCSLRNIRLISVEDRFDTKDQIFSQNSTLRMMQIIRDLPNDIYRQRVTSGEVARTDARPHLTSKREARMQKERRVITMYLTGHSIEVIMKMCNIKHTALYQILKRNGIKRDRVHKDGVNA